MQPSTETQSNLEPLLPEKAIEYFHDASQPYKDYLRAVSIRNCLEYIVDTVFIYIANDGNAETRWAKKDCLKK